jgi:heme-degrading monooxygenase HmoA
VLPELRGIAGFAGASLLTCKDGSEVEIVVLTRWRSMDAIRAFAGADPERAVVEPEAMAALLRFDAAVRHYELVEEAIA